MAAAGEHWNEQGCSCSAQSVVRQKRRIVQATFTPGVSIAQVAREHGVNGNQLHSWPRICQVGRLV